MLNTLHMQHCIGISHLVSQRPACLNFHSCALTPGYSIIETDVRHKRTTIDAKHGVTTEIVTQRLPREQTDCDGEENAPLTEECGIGK